MQTTQRECDKSVSKATQNPQLTANELPETLLATLLLQRGENISVAESCTGGNIAHRLTAMEGASQYFSGGVVSYANEVKINLLHVSLDTLQKHGAVSRQVAEQMATGARIACQTTYAIATTGIAGPSGGSYEKPVGTIWIAVATPTKIISQIFHSHGSRNQNIDQFSDHAIKMLLNHLCELSR